MPISRDSSADDAQRRRRDVLNALRAFADSLPEAILVVGADGRILIANARTEAVFGYLRPELLGQDVEVLFPPDYQSTHGVRRESDAGDPARPEVGSQQVWGLHKDGTTVPVEVDLSPLDAGGISAFCVTIRDASERHAMEEELRRSEERFQALANQASEGIFIADSSGYYQEVNPAVCAMLGYSREEILGMSLTDVVAPEERSCIADEIARWRTGRAVRSEWRFQHSDGSLFNGEVNGVRLSDSRLLARVRDGSHRRRVEDDLRASQQFIEAIAAASPPTIYVFDLDDLQLIYENRSMLEQLGYPPHVAAFDDLESFKAFMPQSELMHLGRVLEEWRSLARGQVREDEYVIRDAHGAARSFLGRETVFASHTDGTAKLILGTLYDITERKGTEELLRQSEERYRLIVENQTEFIVKWLPDGTRTFVNDSYCRTFGRREEECIGTSFFPLVAREYRESIRARTAALTPEAPEYTEEHVALVPGGERWQQWTSKGIFDADGRLVEILSTGRDITERKEAERKLLESQRHLIASQHIARVGSWELDLRAPDESGGNARRWSDECFRIFGYEPGAIDVTADVHWRCVHPDDRQRVSDVRSLALQNRSPYALDHRILRPDGTERLIHVQADVATDPATGDPVKFIGTVQDITDRVRLEEQLRQSQKMQAIGQLAGGVAHDFNNLLTVINGHADALLDTKSPEDADRNGLTAIRDAAQRAALLTRQLLLFSRKAVLEPRVLDCNELVRRTSQMLRRLISEDVELSTTLAPSLWRTRVDSGQIEQILMNLSLNACDAMPRGGRLTIETSNVTFDEEYCRSHPECRAGRYVQLAVSDTGIGMTAHVKAHLFEPFFTTKGPGKGTGLGLATVYGIVQECGGFLMVSSAVDAGTTFHICLPALDGADTILPSPAIDRTRLRGYETVLLVEDDATVRQIAALTLVKYGYMVLEAANGPAALEVVNRYGGAIDILVSDIVMPEMNGRTVADAVRARHPGCRVLFMSGYNEDMLVRRGVHIGAEAFIQKPFAPEAFVTKLRETLGRPA